MKIPKLQFRLATIFAALTLCGMVMAVYRHYTVADERIHYHASLRNSANLRVVNADQYLDVYQQSREALLAGEENRLENLATRFRFGQPIEIVYVPAQLAAIDKALRDKNAERAQEEIIEKYHAQMITEYENSRWHPWHRVAELASPPKSIYPADAGQLAPQLGQ